MKPELQKNTICRLCLKNDVNVYKIGSTHHKAFLESLFKLKELNSFQVPSDNHYVCYMCVALLSKTSNFIKMICNAQTLVYDILKCNDSVTKDLLKNIDRHKDGLDSFELCYVHIFDVIEFIHDQNHLKCIPIIKDVDKLCIENSFSSDKKHKKPAQDGSEFNDGKIVKGESDFNDSEIVKDLLILNNNILAEKDGFIANNKKQPKPLKSKAVKVNNKPKYSNSSESEISRSTVTKNRNKKVVDYDYQPDSTSHSEDSDFDSYDDNGKQIKLPKHEDRTYPRKCDHCDYEVPIKSNHYRHYQYEHRNINYPYAIEKCYACSFCGKLMSKHRINEHERTHIISEVKCPICPRVFPSQKKMLEHKSYVHPKKTFTCDYCSKIFKTRTDIMRHIRIHTGEKPYKCHICGAGFAHSGNRTIHIRSAHQNYKYVPKKNKNRKDVHNKRNTDMESRGKEELQKKIKNTKRLRKIKEEDNSAEIKLDVKKNSRNRKKHKQKSKKIVDYTAEELGSEVGKRNIQINMGDSYDTSTDMNPDNKHDAQIDSDDENLAMKKIKNKCRNEIEIDQPVGEIDSDDENLAQKKSKKHKILL